MDTSTMISHLERNGVLELPIAMVGDLMDIDRRVKHGDAVYGWRGDETMGVFLNALTREFEIWGIDRQGKEYLAASHHTLDQTLIRKLAEGDPRYHDQFQRVLDHNAKLVADRKARDRDEFNVVGDKIRWAIRREFHNGRADQTSIPRKVGG